MQCPNCYSSIPNDVTTCPRCDWALRQPAPSGSSAAWGSEAMRGGWQADAATDNAPLWGNAPTPTPQWDAPARPAADWSATPMATPLADSATPQPGSQAAPAWAGSQPAPPAQGAAPLGQVPPPFGASPVPPAFPGAGQQAMPWNAAGQAAGQTGQTQVPLDPAHKRSLIFQGCFPLAIVGVMFTFILFNPGRSNLSSVSINMPPYVYLIIIAMLFLVLLPAAKAFRDVSNGYAIQEVRRVERLRRVRSKNSTHYYVYFDTNQRMNASRTLYNSLRKGGVYRFTYAPNTKKLFAADPVSG